MATKVQLDQMDQEHFAINGHNAFQINMSR